MLRISDHEKKTMEQREKLEQHRPYYTIKTASCIQHKYFMQHIVQYRK
ncbi:hypothetical protein ACIGHG_24815 [Bacillus sp. NPDC077411]|uniref:Uncharacterized protein n=1 Tax=Bacillus bruguierae TaxID=3127667 RepID=A0ABU8FIS1_9BACI|nr:MULTISPECIES: hypothetical protein [unclassified Bacillus (in: firmicutes)]SFJ49672.1 hypothetical protein SAMN04488574_1156 [Bacillus sp. 71mf]SFT04369.1 hypothetical protein SAMN04488145_10887 [Bacillus sp. 103mf]